MTPFLHFRSWLRSGPATERLLTATSALLLLSFVVWASVPSGALSDQDSLQAGDPSGQATGNGSGGSTAAATGGATGPTGGQAATTGGSGAGSSSGAIVGGGGPRGSTSGAPAAGGTTSGSTTGGGSVAGGPTAPAGCGPLTSTDQGVTATTITLGVIIVDLSAASGIIDYPTAQDQEKAWKAVFDYLNDRGGVRCRKVILKYYRENPLDSSAEHAVCLDIQQDKVFAVFNNLYTATEQTCVAKAGIPNVWYTPPHTAEVRKYSPYILSWQPDFDRLIHQYVAGAKALGYFKGMKKLGILEGSCFPDERVALFKELRAAGIDPGKASTFNYGCTGAPAPQSDQSAVLQFQREGVTHVLNIAFTYDGTFSRAADQQGYDPAFAHMDDVSATSMESGSQKPGASFDGTLLISTTETGAGNTKGYRYNRPTQDCTKILAAAGLPAAYSRVGTNSFGLPCVDATLFKAAAENAPSLTRRQLATGLARSGRLELAFPAGPLNVTDPALPTSGQLARPGVWATACQCWRVTDVRYRSF